MNNTITMEKSHEAEVLHLFEVMRKHNVRCGLELQVEGFRDPLFGICDARVRSEYLEASEGDSIIVYLDDIEFGFEVGTCDFSKHISERRIEIGIAGPNFMAWFNSDTMTPEAIAEANNYKELVEDWKLIDVFVADENESIAEKFDELAAHIREGWHIENIEDNVGNDGRYLFTLFRTKDECYGERM